MVALILAAGYGTRLYPLTEETPKALLPVGGKPILQHLLEKLSPHLSLVRRSVLVSNRRYTPLFRQWLKEHEPPLSWELLDDGSTSEENRLGSVGDLVFAIKSASIEDDLLVIGSDNLFQDPLSGFLQCAKEKSPGITLGAYQLPDRSLASRYGVLRVNEALRVVQFEEKPKNPASSLISTAIYFFPRERLSLVLEYGGFSTRGGCASGAGRSLDTLGSFVRWLVAREKVFAHCLAGPWFDIGDMVSYQNAQEHFSI